LSVLEETHTQDAVICNRRGLHARASAKFAKQTAQLDALILVSKDGVSVTGTSIMGLMMLGAAKGDTITISATGPGARDALAQLCALIASRFGEEE